MANSVKKTSSNQVDIFDILEKPSDAVKKSLQKILLKLKEIQALVKTA